MRVGSNPSYLSEPNSLGLEGVSNFIARQFHGACAAPPSVGLFPFPRQISRRKRSGQGRVRMLDDPDNPAEPEISLVPAGSSP